MTDDHKYVPKYFTGTPASYGLVSGPAFIYVTDELILNNTEISPSQIRDQQKQAESAFRILDLQLRKLLDLTNDETESEANEIINFQRDILKDPDLIASVNSFVRSDYQTADKAVHSAFRKYIDRLASSPSHYFKDRIVDLRDIRDRLIQIIQQKYLLQDVQEKDIVVCREVTPGDILLFSRKKVGGIISEQGGITSHAAIIAKSVGIPLMMSVKGITESVQSRDVVLIDCDNSQVILNPEEKNLSAEKDYKKSKNESASDLPDRISRPTKMACGYHIPIMANIELVEELDMFGSKLTEGIGLLRTESFIMNKTDNGSSDDDYTIYEKAIKSVDDAPLNIRLYDIGGDKLPGFTKAEPNPFLGWRGVRLLLDRKSLLISQLDLIFDAAINHQKKIQLIIPMVTNKDDVTEIKGIVHERLALKPEAVDLISVGIMVEVPAVAILADYYLEQVEFVTIGTNDLTQYTLAADRTNSLVQHYFNQVHPAVWYLINRTIEAGKRVNKPVALCGELASNPKAALILVGMGISSLSMSPAAIPEVKTLLLRYTKADAEKIAKEILKCTSEKEINIILESIN